MFREVKNFIVDLFFPVYCINCGREGNWLCKKCEEKINFVKSSFCIKCNRLTENRRLCDSCRRKSHLKGVFILGFYNDEMLKKIIWEFKYNFISDIGFYFGSLLAGFIKKEIDLNNSIFVGVPLDKKRQSWRGFNQSEILAREVAKNLKANYIKNVLRRNRNTESQIGLTRKQREKNIADAFSINRVINSKIVYLVDDVITTGATLEECAKELKNAGVREVWGVVLVKD